MAFLLFLQFLQVRGLARLRGSSEAFTLGRDLRGCTLLWVASTG